MKALGALGEAKGSFAQALRIFRRLGYVHGQILALVGLTKLSVALGLYEDARECCRKAWPILHKTGSLLYGARYYLTIGTIEMDLGEHGEASKNLQTALGSAEQCRMPEWVWRCQHALGMLAYRRGDYAEAYARYAGAAEKLKAIWTTVPSEHRDRYLDDPDRRALREDFLRLRGESVRTSVRKREGAE